MRVKTTKVRVKGLLLKLAELQLSTVVCLWGKIFRHENCQPHFLSNIPTVHSESDRHLDNMQVFLRLSNSEAELFSGATVHPSLPQGPRVTCWAHDLQELYIYSRVNSVSIYSKHYFKTLPTGSGVSDHSLGWCHAVKTEFEFRALTWINKPCWFRNGITEQLPLAKFQQGAPQKLSRALSPCPSYL